MEDQLAYVICIVMRSVFHCVELVYYEFINISKGHVTPVEYKIRISFYCSIFC